MAKNNSFEGCSLHMLNMGGCINLDTFLDNYPVMEEFIFKWMQNKLSEREEKISSNVSLFKHLQSNI